jgi:hypothetical protein
MWRSCVATLLLVLCPLAASAVDLTKIERTAVKLPELRSGAAEFCLLVFGPEAAKRVWVAHDGDILYVDRNSNGDLTEPDERVTAIDVQGEELTRVIERLVGKRDAKSAE